MINSLVIFYFLVFKLFRKGSWRNSWWCLVVVVLVVVIAIATVVVVDLLSVVMLRCSNFGFRSIRI